MTSGFSASGRGARRSSVCVSSSKAMRSEDAGGVVFGADSVPEAGVSEPTEGTRPGTATSSRPPGEENEDDDEGEPEPWPAPAEEPAPPPALAPDVLADGALAAACLR